MLVVRIQGIRQLLTPKEDVATGLELPSGHLSHLYEGLSQKLSTTLVKVCWKFSDDAL
jgi:hypothetical protein